jgi:hypothetical protein
MAMRALDCSRLEIFTDHADLSLQVRQPGEDKRR